MNKTMIDVAIALYGVPHSVSCKVCKANNKCKLQHEELSCVDCIEEGLKKLIDRATPIKPIKNGSLTKLDKFLGIQQSYTCPTCGNACLVRYAPNDRNENRYCYDCGQAIDWSDKDEINIA